MMPASCHVWEPRDVKSAAETKSKSAMRRLFQAEVSPARLLVLCGGCLRLLLSQLRLCLQPIVQFVPIASAALLVQFVGTTTNLLLKLTISRKRESGGRFQLIKNKHL